MNPNTSRIRLDQKIFDCKTFLTAGIFCPAGGVDFGAVLALRSLPEILKIHPRSPLAAMTVFRMDQAAIDLQSAGEGTAQAKPGDQGTQISPKH
jgi:hypothetical protein